jgi:hypothetical protein
MLPEALRLPVLNIHAFATLAMVGLIWFVQVVHYPLFARVGSDTYTAYQTAHMSRTSLIVGPLMLAELATALLILLGAWSSRPLAIAGLILLAIAWFSTFFLQIPRHATLERGYDARAAASLVSTNWIRTIAWTARGILALLMLRHAAPQ